MESTGIQDYVELWTVDKDKYVLVKPKIGGALDGYLGIVDVSSSEIVAIHDDEIHDQVVEKMKSAGVPVVDRSPG